MKRRITEVFRVLEDRCESGNEPEAAYCFGQSEEYEVRVASSAADRETAWRLVYEAYLEKGYAEPNPQRLWYSIYDALPETVTLLVERQADGCGLKAEGKEASAFGLQPSAQSAPVGTLTLVFDSSLGLPADGLYRAELDAMRSRGRRLCEIVSRASAENDLRRGAEIMKHLVKLCYYAVYRVANFTDFVITVNPRHVSFHRRLLMTELGPERSYGRVGGAPAVLLGMDLVNAYEAYRQAFDGLPGDRNLFRLFRKDADRICRWLSRERRPLDPEALRRYFVEERQLLADAPAGVRRSIELACGLTPVESAGEEGGDP